MEILNNVTNQVIEDLRNEIEELSKSKSNIEVVWKLEKLHNEKAFLKSAELIRKFI
jgi:hypothetical protein